MYWVLSVKKKKERKKKKNGWRVWEVAIPKAPAKSPQNKSESAVHFWATPQWGSHIKTDYLLEQFFRKTAHQVK